MSNLEVILANPEVKTYKISFFFVCATRDWTQGFKAELFPKILSFISFTFYFGTAQTLNPPDSASYSAGTTGMIKFLFGGVSKKGERFLSDLPYWGFIFQNSAKESRQGRQFKEDKYIAIAAYLSEL